MLLTYSSRDLSKKSLRIDLFDFFIPVKKSKLCYNKIKKHSKQRRNKMNKIYNNLNINNLMKTNWKNQFNEKQ